MKLSEIRELPTTIDSGPNGHRVHESTLRGYHILNKVVEHLAAGSNPLAVLEIIDDLRSAPEVDRPLTYAVEATK